MWHSEHTLIHLQVTGPGLSFLDEGLFMMAKRHPTVRELLQLQRAWSKVLEGKLHTEASSSTKPNQFEPGVHVRGTTHINEGDKAGF